MTLAPELLEILVDPQDKEPLYYFADESSLYNPRTQRRYEVRNENIPVLLVDEATTVKDDEHARLMNKVETDGLVPTGGRHQ